MAFIARRVLPATLPTWRSPATVRCFTSTASLWSTSAADKLAALEAIDWSSFTDDELVAKVQSKELPMHLLEKLLDDCTRAVTVRRGVFSKQLSVVDSAAPAAKPRSTAFAGLPLDAFNADEFYNKVFGANCEAVVGYLPLPIGAVGPLELDGTPFIVPMATTEGALLASTNRGCRVITLSGGATSIVTTNGMTRAPLVRVPSISHVDALLKWVKTPENFAVIKEAFDSTSRFGRLQNVTPSSAGRNVYLRFKCGTGDAMGMNMITKGVNAALEAIAKHHPDMRVLSLSGNVCCDKKSSAVNWLDGRGKSVSCEVVIPKDVLSKVLHTTAKRMVELNISKNLVGSSMAASIGGNNAHASNMVTAVFLATGQDAAQNVESSNCMTLMEEEEDGSLCVSVSMPCVEVGTVGGGTGLPAQRAMLELMGIGGACEEEPGRNAETLARVVAGTVLAGEISLMAALTTNDLLKAHLDLNRKDGAPATEGAEGAAAGGAGSAAAASASRTMATVHSSVPAAVMSPGRKFFAAALADPVDDTVGAPVFSVP